MVPFAVGMMAEAEEKALSTLQMLSDAMCGLIIL